MQSDNVVVVGAGIGGLACAIDLAYQGIGVCVVERSRAVGGKMRECLVGGRAIDSGPTVFTMRWVFDDLFQSVEADLDHFVTLAPLEILARHAWSAEERLDLFADLGRATEAIGRFSGSVEAAHFLSFCLEARAIYRTLKGPFLTESRPGPVMLARRIGLHRLSQLCGIRPFETLWQALSKQFHDPRLRQLFGRYATYGGSSPFAAPATLMLIAHVEREGVWQVVGGMQRLAEALERLAVSLGVVFRFGQEATDIILDGGRARGVTLMSGERIGADAVVVNGDSAAIAAGCFGQDVRAAVPAIAAKERSLSAVTWARVARSEGFPLLRHNVFFSKDYAGEFADLFGRGRLPADPTVYICAQDRTDRDGWGPPDGERLLLLVNAPPTGDGESFDAVEIDQCERRVSRLLERCGLSLSHSPEAAVITTPRDFHHLFPGTGGALYGRASHGWKASFQRPTAQTAIPGLYLAGGSTHPGAGVPMSALSGRLAAWRLISDRLSTRRYHPAAIFGGISMA